MKTLGKAYLLLASVMFLAGLIGGIYSGIARADCEVAPVVILPDGTVRTGVVICK